MKRLLTMTSLLPSSKCYIERKQKLERFCIMRFELCVMGIIKCLFYSENMKHFLRTMNELITLWSVGFIPSYYYKLLITISLVFLNN